MKPIDYLAGERESGRNRLRDPRRLGDRYRDQLRIYADAVRGACGLDYLPRTELWLVRAGRVLEL